MDGMKIVGDLFGAGQDVPAAGGEERARDEAGRRLPRAVHGGREATLGGTGDRPGQDRDGDREGRRPRHRQEHRGRRAGLQQLRGDRPGRHGAGRRSCWTPRSRRGATSSAVSGLITPSLDEMVNVAKEMERRGMDPAAADRRRDHVATAHGGADRARVLRADRSSTCIDASRVVGVVVVTCSTRAQGRASTPTNRDAAGDAPRPARRAREARRCSPTARRSSSATADRVAARGRRRAPSFTGHADRSSRTLAELRDVHRLDVLLHGLGAEGPLPADPRPPEHGAAARELFDERAGAARRDRSTDGSLQARGVYGFWPANSRRRRHRARRTA